MICNRNCDICSCHGPCGKIWKNDSSEDPKQDFFGIFGIFGIFFRIFWIFAPPGSPNRLKMMPRDVGSISTPADSPSAIFNVLLFRGWFVISSKKSLPEKSKPYINLEIYCITKKCHTDQKMRNVQHIGKSGIDIQNDFMRVELSHFPSENVEQRPKSGWGNIEGPALILFQLVRWCSPQHKK